MVNEKHIIGFLGGIILSSDSTYWFKPRGSVTDFNSAINSGVYNYVVNNIVTSEDNGPVGARGYGTLVVFVSSVKYITQIYIEGFLQNNKLYIRYRQEAANAWSTWKFSTLSLLQ